MFQRANREDFQKQNNKQNSDSKQLIPISEFQRYTKQADAEKKELEGNEQTAQKLQFRMFSSMVNLPENEHSASNTGSMVF